jgi:hypothetical protein
MSGTAAANSLVPTLVFQGIQQSLRPLANAWVAAVANAHPRFRADGFYGGRSFSDSLAVRRKLDCTLRVVSTGLGLVREFDDVPQYDLTVADGPASIKPYLDASGAELHDWWAALSEAKGSTPCPLAHLVSSSEMVFIALPARYLEMVRQDLMNVPVSHQSRLRIFTSPAGRQFVPASLSNAILPYDERLEGEGSPRPGTRTDFAQRAMRHFVDDLRAHGEDLDTAHRLVESALRPLKLRTLPNRRRATDAEIKALIASSWDEYRGSASRLLRALRDDLFVSCEQGRFRSLCVEFRLERQRVEQGVRE